MNNFIYYDYASSSVCKVQEDQSDFVKASSIPSYLNQLCLENGSSLQGRKDAYKYIMHQSKFIPIRIHSSLIYFPTKAVADPECIWINYYSIDYVNYRKKSCTIFFLDHTALHCANSKRIKHILQSIGQYVQRF